jgi:hypothetical protein
MDNLYLKPRLNADGAPMLVRDPIGWKPLATAGEWKPASNYWFCRVRDKDVIDGTAEKIAADATEAAAAAAKKLVVPTIA